MKQAPLILLVNPWITDFAAHDLWAKPLGLLSLAALLREGGCGTVFIDCLDRHDPFTNRHPDCLGASSRKYGTGKFPRMVLPKPEILAELPRRWFRHGIHPDSLRTKLQEAGKPDLIWVTSMMTYWYPGVQETVRIVKEVYPETVVWLGGIYARLCRDHAGAHSGADRIVTESPGELPALLQAQTGFSLRNAAAWGDFSHWPGAARDLLPRWDYAPIMTSVGCPYHCPYCASSILQPHWKRKSAERIVEEIGAWHTEKGVVDFAFYDDALLLGRDEEVRRALLKVCRKGWKLRFHTPNAIHIRALTQEWCDLLHASGFCTLRLGLETTRLEKQREWGGKVEPDMFRAAVERLRKSGFRSEQIGVYLLTGLPGQQVRDVADAVAEVEAAGASPFLSEYSPVPGTAMWREACGASSFDIAREPLTHNNTFFACRREDFSLTDLQGLKTCAQEARRRVQAGTAFQ